MTTVAGEGRLRRAGAVLGAMLSVGLVASACSGGGEAPTIATDLAAPERSSNAAGHGIVGKQVGPPEEPTAPSDGRQVIHTASLDIDVRDLGRTTARVRQLSEREGGYLAEEDSHRGGTRLVVKAPAERLSRVLDELSGFGRVTNRTQRAEDVTDQLVDTRSRIDSQRASVERLRGLLGEAESISEIVQIESELTSRESELDALERRQAALAGQVDLATITVLLSEKSAPVHDDDGGFLAGLAGGWEALSWAGKTALTVIGAVLPFAVVCGVPVLALWLGWRRLRAQRA